MTPAPRRVRLLLAASAVVVAGAAMTAAPAGAQAPPARFQVADGVVTAAGQAPTAVGSRVLAGYRADLDGRATHTLTASLVAPSVDCTGARNTVLFTGAQLFGRALDSNDPDLVVALLEVSCRTPTQADYAVLVGTAPTFVSIAVPVAAGDTLTFAVGSSHGSSRASVRDGRGRVLLSARDDGFRVARAQVTVQAGYGGARFPHYDTAQFTGVRLDGAPFADADPVTVFQRDAAGRALYAPSRFSATGDAFPVVQLPPGHGGRTPLVA